MIKQTIDHTIIRAAFVRSPTPPRSFDGSSPNLVGVCRWISELPLRGSFLKSSTGQRVKRHFFGADNTRLRPHRCKRHTASKSLIPFTGIFTSTKNASCYWSHISTSSVHEFFGMSAPTALESHYPLGNHLLTTGTDDPTLCEGDNYSEGSTVPVVSRWLWPGNRTHLEVAGMVVTCTVTPNRFRCKVTSRSIYIFMQTSPWPLDYIGEISWLTPQGIDAEKMEKLSPFWQYKHWHTDETYD